MQLLGKVVGVLALFWVSITPAVAQVDDHLKCYKIRDPLLLKRIVDLDSRQFGLEPGCKISRAQLFCVPVTKKVREVFKERHRSTPCP